MTYTATATYFPVHALAPIEFGACKADTRDEAVAILIDDIREFMRNERSLNWWDDVILTVEHDHIKTNYAFEYWGRKFAWSL